MCTVMGMSYLVLSKSSVQLAVNYCQYKSSTIVTLGISCHVGHFCSSQVLQPRRTTDYISALAACIARSDTFSSRRKFLPSPLSDVYGIFISRVSPSSSWSQAKSTHNSLCCLGSLLDASYKQLAVEFPIPDTGVVIR